jgi:hypothetical protein
MDQLLNLIQKKNEVLEKKQLIENQIENILDGDVGVFFKNASGYPEVYICDCGLNIKDNMETIQKIVNNFDYSSINFPKNSRIVIKIDRVIRPELVEINGVPHTTLRETDEIDEDTKQPLKNGIYEYQLNYHDSVLKQIVDRNHQMTINL